MIVIDGSARLYKILVTKNQMFFFVGNRNWTIVASIAITFLLNIISHDFSLYSRMFSTSFGLGRSTNHIPRSPPLHPRSPASSPVSPPSAPPSHSHASSSSPFSRSTSASSTSVFQTKLSSVLAQNLQIDEWRRRVFQHSNNHSPESEKGRPDSSDWEAVESPVLDALNASARVFVSHVPVAGHAGHAGHVVLTVLQPLLHIDVDSKGTVRRLSTGHREFSSPF